VLKYKFHTMKTNVRKEVELQSFLNSVLIKLTNQLTPWSRVLLQRLTVTQLAKKFPTFCGT